MANKKIEEIKNMNDLVDFVLSTANDKKPLLKNTEIFYFPKSLCDSFKINKK